MPEDPNALPASEEDGDVDGEPVDATPPEPGPGPSGPANIPSLVPPDDDPVLLEIKKTRRSLAKMRKDLRTAQKRGTSDVQVPEPVPEPESELEIETDLTRMFFRAIGGVKR